MHDKLEQYLTHYSAYQEVGEGGIGYLEAGNHALEPVISIGHGACSAFIMADVDCDGAVKRATVFHSSLNGFASHQYEKQQETFINFLRDSDHVIGIPVERHDRSGEGFMVTVSKIAHKYGKLFDVAPPIKVGGGSKAGWSALIDIHEEPALRVQIAGKVEEYDVRQHIETFLQNDLTTQLSK